MIGRKTGLALMMGVATVMLAASGDGGSDKKDDAPQKAAVAVNPCSFLTAQDVAAITGDAVLRTSASGASCTYHAHPDDGVEVTIHAGDGEKRMLDMQRTVKFLGGMGKKVSESGKTGEDVERLLREDADKPNLGDEAVWAPASILAVRKGSFYVEVKPPIMHHPATHGGYPLISRDDRRKIAMQVAQAILARATP